MAQPARGFRAGLDSVLLGAAVTADKGALLDLGAGVGAAALVALAHRPALSALLAEREPQALALAAENITANGFADRARLVDLDVTAPGEIREAAGLGYDSYAAVIANPPFFVTERGTASPRPGRRVARQMGTDELDLWVKTAAASAAPGADVIFVMPVETLAPLLAAFDARFGGLTLLPLLPRPEALATRVLLRGTKGSRGPLRMLASRALHGVEGNAFAPWAEAILRGTARLDW